MRHFTPNALEIVLETLVVLGCTTISECAGSPLPQKQPQHLAGTACSLLLARPTSPSPAAPDVSIAAKSTATKHATGAGSGLQSGGRRGSATKEEGLTQTGAAKSGARYPDKPGLSGANHPSGTEDSALAERCASNIDLEQAVCAFQAVVKRVMRAKAAADRMVAAAVAVLSRPDYTAVAVGESNTLLRISQVVFNQAMSLIMTHGNHPECCLGQRVVAPVEHVVQLMSVPPQERGLRTAAKVLTLLSCHKWLMRFPLCLQMQLVARAELHVFAEDQLIFRQVCHRVFRR
jgi:hypothetical protein